MTREDTEQINAYIQIVFLNITDIVFDFEEHRICLLRTILNY